MLPSRHIDRAAWRAEISMKLRSVRVRASTLCRGARDEPRLGCAMRRRQFASVDASLVGADVYFT